MKSIGRRGRRHECRRRVHLCDVLAQAAQGAAPKRREVSIGRKRIKVI